jgi:hypothetical protein
MRAVRAARAALLPDALRLDVFPGDAFPEAPLLTGPALFLLAVAAPAAFFFFAVAALVAGDPEPPGSCPATGVTAMNTASAPASQRVGQ